MLKTNDLADYIADNYGLCTLEKCKCRNDNWLGRACPNWRPVTASTLEELRELMKNSNTSPPH
jgi:hypothetical protein